MPSESRRPGAQPGNRNALKHGFYTHQIKRAEARDLEKIEFHGISDEINLLRAYIRRIASFGQDILDTGEFMENTRVLCLALLTLNRLLRTQNMMVNDQGGELTIALNQVLTEMTAEGLIPDFSKQPPE